MARTACLEPGTWDSWETRLPGGIMGAAGTGALSKARSERGFGLTPLLAHLQGLFDNRSTSQR